MKKGFIFVLIVTFVLSFLQPVLALTEGEEIQLLKTQVKELMQRIEQLEQGQAKEKETIEKQKEEIAKKVEPTVQLDKLTSKLKIKGRWAGGFYDSGKQGSYPNSSFEVPEAKLQFAFEPDDINKVIMRMSLNNAAFNNLDYFYIDSKLAKALSLPFDLNSRFGRMKLDFGEETWSNNPVESILPSNSAGNVSGSDEGLQLSGKIGKERPLGWAASLVNGPAGTGSDVNEVKAFTGKISYNIFEPLYISASYHNSGSLMTSNSEMSIAGLATRPTGATDWDREIWEADLRYDFCKGKISVPAYSDSTAFIRIAYGHFDDDAKPVVGRDGNYGFAEAAYNLTKKIYLAGRYSIVDLENDVTASLNSVTANRYTRYSAGLGYRWSENTILKVGYDWNDESGPGTDEVDNNLLSAIVASQF